MSMPRAVRHINEVRILASLFHRGTTTRADLARELGLMRSTVGNLVGGLIAQGLVVEATLADVDAGGRSGRPGQGVAMNARHAAFVGADIGVGQLSVVAVDLLGEPVASRTVAIEPTPGDADATIAALADLVQALLRDLSPAQPVLGLCVTVPGLVSQGGQVVRAPVLGWRGVPLKQALTARLGWSGPLSLENDANAFAAAELFGRDPPRGEALYVYLDAGVGGGLASHGRLLRGQRGFAGEIGHIHLGEQGFETRTAVQGSFESYVGRDAVLARVQQHGGRADTLDGLLAGVAAAEPAALRTLADWAWWLGRGLASLISVLDPGRIVLGGPVAALLEPARPQVLASIERHLVTPFELPSLVVSVLGSSVCALGAARGLLHDHLSIDESLVFGSPRD
ncbi:MAG: hypothetical protein RIQ60_1178 [Pseudomonadota bacterium]|jgi:predicted NBD/HSP70 family sugar kinase